MVLVFFFKQKTAYEMRISDWSSDVCSSDLLEQRVTVGPFVVGPQSLTGAQRADEQLGFEFVRSQQIDIRVPAEGDAGILGAVNILFVDRRDQVQRSDFLQRQDRKSTRLNSSH